MGELFGISVEWLLGSIDATRPHEITPAQAWHGRLMLLAWGICIPLGIFIARYLKVTPNQIWPEELDNIFWWRSHLTLQIGGTGIMLLALCIILTFSNSLASFPVNWHGWIGWTIISLACMQIASGYLRGSKGGPTAPSADGNLRGDHFDMSRRRVLFEAFHKTVGYLLLLGGASGVLHGMWTANASRWMFVCIISFWVLLGVSALIISRRFVVRNTYHAIWGPDPNLPGNQRN